MVHSSLPVAILGAGPIGLASAAHLAERSIPFVVLDAARGVGSTFANVPHVRLFTPWKLNVDPVAARLLARGGWIPPPAEELPTGRDLVERYLDPLARTPEIAARLRLGTRVLGIARLGASRLSSAPRAGAPFVLRVEGPEGEEDVRARAVLDATGTAIPHALGADGLPALGERANADRIFYGMPDVFGAHRARYAGRTTLVVGAGHSAGGTLLALAELAGREPGTRVVWAIRAATPARLYAAGAPDRFSARQDVYDELRNLLEKGAIELHAGFRTASIARRAGTLDVASESGEVIPGVDEIVCATGWGPDHSLARELRTSLDPRFESAAGLASIVDPDIHTCGTVPAHGARELTHPEPDYYAIGSKSYGRAPNFLLATGYEQVRSVVEAIAQGAREA